MPRRKPQFSFAARVAETLRNHDIAVFSNRGHIYGYGGSGICRPRWRLTWLEWSTRVIDYAENTLGRAWDMIEMGGEEVFDWYRHQDLTPEAAYMEVQKQWDAGQIRGILGDLLE